ncbi:MAG: protein kinase [Deltaproteobacteria bacterium]|nr:protein kinase [Deltaproteobacteria bacterium]
MRVCPLCGSRNEAAHCPGDGTATIRLVENPPQGLPVPGDVIAGRYRILDVLGAGGFGAVFRVTHTGTGQECALKVLILGRDRREQAMRRFFAEARITAGLKHANTVRVFDFGQDDRGWYFLAMELLIGRSLAQWLTSRRQRRQTMTQGEAVYVAVAVLRSLTEAHGAGLVHRDLKPHNIFLHEVVGDEPLVKVLDFGIAKSAEFALTMTDQALGTPSYMSPEQCLAEALDGRSDLYSIGCLLYHMVVGQPPFVGDSVASIVLKQVQAPPPDVYAVTDGRVTREFAAVIAKALQKSPADRFASAADMRQALRACEQPHDWHMQPAPADGGEVAVDDVTSEAFAVHRPPQLATVVVPRPPGQEVEHTDGVPVSAATPSTASATPEPGPLPASATVAYQVQAAELPAEETTVDREPAAPVGETPPRVAHATVMAPAASSVAASPTADRTERWRWPHWVGAGATGVAIALAASAWLPDRTDHAAVASPAPVAVAAAVPKAVSVPLVPTSAPVAALAEAASPVAVAPAAAAARSDPPPAPVAAAPAPEHAGSLGKPNGAGLRRVAAFGAPARPVAVVRVPAGRATAVPPPTEPPKVQAAPRPAPEPAPRPAPSKEDRL